MDSYIRDQFDFEISDRVTGKILFFNKILEDLGVSRLFDNPDFQLYEDFIGSSVISFRVKQGQERDNAWIWIFFQVDGIRLDIDHVGELFEWTNEYIEKSPDELSKFIKNILTGYILIETNGASKFLQIFDSEGNFVDCASRNNLFHMATGKYLFSYSNQRKLYFPLYPVRS